MYFEFKQRALYYDLRGQGTPILLLNGVMMSSASWQPLLPAWSPYFQVICFDFPDQGLSEHFPEGYDQSLMVEAVEALREHLGIDKWHVLGISYGGEVAMQYAQRHSDRLLKLVLANTTAWTFPQLKMMGDGWIDASLSYNPRVFFRTCMPAIYGRSFYEAHGDWLRQREDDLDKTLKQEWFDGLVRLIRSAENHDQRDLLQNIQIPTLIIGADEDQVTPVAMQEELHKAISNSVLVVIRACGHASMYEQQSAFEAIVLGWLLRNGSKA